MAGRELRGLSVDELLEELAGSEPSPGAGSAAALTAASAAALVVMAARASTSWAEAGGATAQALALRDRLAALAEEDAVVYAESLAALAVERDDAMLGDALDRAAQAPLAIADTASDVALLAANAVAHVEPALQADVQGAAVLAAAAAAASARLVEVNLTVGADDARVRRAHQAARRAAAVVQSP